MTRSPDRTRGFRQKCHTFFWFGSLLQFAFQKWTKLYCDFQRLMRKKIILNNRSPSPSATSVIFRHLIFIFIIFISRSPYPPPPPASLSRTKHFQTFANYATLLASLVLHAVSLQWVGSFCSAQWTVRGFTIRDWFSHLPQQSRRFRKQPLGHLVNGPNSSWSDDVYSDHNYCGD